LQIRIGAFIEQHLDDLESRRVVVDGQIGSAAMRERIQSSGAIERTASPQSAIRICSGLNQRAAMSK